MKKIFKSLGIHKMDEMETIISLKAQRIAFIYVFTVLAAWSLYESYKVFQYHTKLNLLPCFLLVSASLVQHFSQFILMKRATKGDEEKVSYKNVYVFMLVMALVVVAANVIIVFGIMR